MACTRGEVYDGFLSYVELFVHCNVVHVVEEQVSDQLETAKNPELGDVVSYAYAC